MDKLKKIILVAIIGLVFPCLSLAYPDFYYYNNFLVGQSPYRIFPNDFSAHTDTELWEEYLPSISNDYNGELRSGIVTSFDTRQMSGTTVPSAVPLIDMDVVQGNHFVLPAGHCVAIWSGTGEQYIVATDFELHGLYLGTSRPSAVTYDTSLDLAYNYHDNFLETSLYPLDPPAIWNSSNVSGTYSLEFRYSNRFNLSFTDYDSVDSISPYSMSAVYLLYNDSSYSCRVFTYGGGFGSKLNKETVPLNDVRWILTTSRTLADTTDDTFNYISVIPHIKGDIDIYSPAWFTSDGDTYYYTCYYSSSLNFTSFPTDREYPDCELTVSLNGSALHRFSCPVSQFGGMPTSVPLFLHPYNVVVNFDTSGVYVNGGWIEISNFEELAELLKQNGYTGDLQRVISLLDEINTGGNTGENVKELVGILEGYHEQLMQNGDFGSVTNIFDTYKNLLDFSSDMHWLITANNALFSYFAGFIMLCAMFLILNRIMR